MKRKLNQLSIDQFRKKRKIETTKSSEYTHKEKATFNLLSDDNIYHISLFMPIRCLRLSSLINKKIRNVIIDRNQLFILVNYFGFYSYYSAPCLYVLYVDDDDQEFLKMDLKIPKPPELETVKYYSNFIANRFYYQNKNDLLGLYDMVVDFLCFEKEKEIIKEVLKRVIFDVSNTIINKESDVLYFNEMYKDYEELKTVYSDNSMSIKKTLDVYGIDRCKNNIKNILKYQYKFIYILEPNYYDTYSKITYQCIVHFYLRFQAWMDESLNTYNTELMIEYIETMEDSCYSTIIDIPQLYINDLALCKKSIEYKHDFWSFYIRNRIDLYETKEIQDLFTFCMLKAPDKIYELFLLWDGYEFDNALLGVVNKYIKTRNSSKLLSILCTFGCSIYDKLERMKRFNYKPDRKFIEHLWLNSEPYYDENIYEDICKYLIINHKDFDQYFIKKWRAKDEDFNNVYTKKKNSMLMEHLKNK